MNFCKECNKEIKGSNFYYDDINNNYYCSKSCYQKLIEKEKEKEDKKVLIDTINRIFRLSQPSVRMFAEIKRFREKEGLTYKQISSILHYIYDVKKVNPYVESLYLVSNYKDEAKKYYLDIKANKIKILSSNQEKAAIRKSLPNYSTIERSYCNIDVNEV